jgi:Fe-S-cluster containining protein
MKRREIFKTLNCENLKSAFREHIADILDEIHCTVNPEEIIRDIEIDADYRDLIERWNSLDYRSRRKGWNRLLSMAREIGYSKRPFCVRCGECCQKGSPTLHEEDLELIIYGILKIEDLYTLRKGEIVYSSYDDDLIILSEERIKIREKEGKRECIFYDDNFKACTIYKNRPLQCRVLECWNPASYEKGLLGRMLTRRDVIFDGEGILRIIEEHEKRCPYKSFDRVLRKKGAISEKDITQILDMLRYDYYMRALIVERINISQDKLEFLLGRPLTKMLSIYGLRLEREGEEGFRLVMDDEKLKHSVFKS